MGTASTAPLPATAKALSVRRTGRGKYEADRLMLGCATLAGLVWFLLGAAARRRRTAETVEDPPGPDVTDFGVSPLACASQHKPSSHPANSTSYNHTLSALFLVHIVSFVFSFISHVSRT